MVSFSGPWTLAFSRLSAERQWDALVADDFEEMQVSLASNFLAMRFAIVEHLHVAACATTAQKPSHISKSARNPTIQNLSSRQMRAAVDGYHLPRNMSCSS